MARGVVYMCRLFPTGVMRLKEIRADAGLPLPVANRTKTLNFKQIAINTYNLCIIYN